MLEPKLRGRRAIVVLREGALYLRRIVPLLDRLGFEHVIDSEHSIRRLLNALRDDPATVVLFAFDSPTRGRRKVGFLGQTITTSSSIAYLADVGNARIVTMFWLWRNAKPRMAFDDEFEIDRSRDRLERRQRVVERLYAALEAHVLQSPEQWSGWDYIVPLIEAKPNGNAAA